MTTEENRPKMINRMGAEYLLACWRCSYLGPLQMVAHRNFRDEVVGYLFICPDCLRKIGGKELSMELLEKPK